MLEKSSSIKMEDLFSKVKDKKPRDYSLYLSKKEKDFFNKEKEREMFYEKRKNFLRLTAKTIDPNGEKNKIIDDAKRLNYKKEDIVKNYVLLFNLLNAFQLIGIFAFLGVSLVFVFISINGYLEMMRSGLEGGLSDIGKIILAISIFTLTLFFVLLSKEKFNMRNLVRRMHDFVSLKTSKFLNKIFTQKKYKETLNYCNSEMKSIIFYESKTDNEVYNEFLLEEIYSLEEDGKINEFGDNAYNFYREQVVEKVEEKYKRYCMEKRELEFFEKVLKLKN